MVEWDAPPVLENVLGIEVYEMFWVVEYLQVADSSLVSDMLVEVVPAASVPDGEPLEREGGVVSGVGSTLKAMGKSVEFAFVAVSRHRT